MAGALSAFTAILTAPTQGFTTADSFGPELLLRAMTAAVVARMNSLPVAMLGGVGLGVLEQLLLWNYPQSGLVEVALFVVILVVLVLQPQRRGRDEEKGSWAAVQAMRPLPRRALEIPAVRRLRPGLLIGFLALLVVLPALISNSLSVSVTGIVGFAIVGLSNGVLTGLGGQLSLGQFAIAAIGALVSWAVSSRSGNFPLALLYAGLTAGVVSVLIGIPALRIRGLMLTVTTLGFALATPAWLLNQSWAPGAGREPGRPVVLGHPLSSGRSYYYFAVALFLVCLFLAWNIRRSGFGRLLVAVRDNEDAARAFAVRSSRVKLQGYLVAGFIAGIGGAVYGHSLASITASTFPASFSLNVVVMTVFGGLGVLAGPILGALWVFGLPLFNLASIALLATTLGTVLLILWKPGGLVQLLEPVRDRLVRQLAARRGIDLLRPETDDDAPVSGPVPSARAPGAESNGRHERSAHGAVLLQAGGLVKRFGGIRAVDDVSLVVHRGETLGLIGPNGAGKTTTFELLAGFTRPDDGQIFFDFADISRLAPEERANRGLIRSFQDAALFPTMSVTETVMLALERRQPTRFVASTFGLDRSERRRRPRAEELISYMGLVRYRDKQIQELSTGTRRIVELACLVALEPKCLLLDEPSSGIAQRETEALGGLLQGLKTDLDLTLVVIEHDMPLIMGISDRIVVMDNGRVIAAGPPDVVAADPVVVEAYMGGSITAIERSGRRLTPALSG
jgi:ABC-type branched-subunit amino acid transport system ATPase component/ABC-type branched-subunit amino acid transport system permease subunit